MKNIFQMKKIFKMKMFHSLRVAKKNINFIFIYKLITKSFKETTTYCFVLFYRMKAKDM